ncbi:MAG: AAA family ATPase [Deltaproteobacteria bacterium]|nr:AAA family ATPase [Deltaproteobacteria bacterium]
MAREPIAVTPETIEARRSSARTAIIEAGLPDRTRTAAPGTYGITRTALDLLECLEAGLAAGLATREALLGRIARDRAVGFAAGEPTASERRFASAFGMLVACEELLGATDGLSDAVLPDRAFPPDEVLPVLSDEALGQALCRDLDGYLQHYHGHADPARRLGDEARLAACVRSHVKRTALSARAACSASEHQTLLDALAATTLRLPSVTYAGLERRAASDDEEPDLLDVAPEDIVGNAEVLAAGLKLARTVAAFDLAAGKNPRILDNPVLFVLGSPGCGKTVTAHAIGRAFLGLCRETGLPARFRVIRRTDWASHYQNKSASDLLRIFREEVFGFHGVCGCYWPDIDTAFAARSDPDIRSEEKSNLATLFGILDGTVGPRNGKWFLLCDANTTQMDDAMVSRLTQDPKIAKGPETAADYVRLLRDLKLRAFRPLLPPDPEWERIGETLADAALSGRAVAAIAGRIAAELQDVEEPPGFFAMSYEEKLEALRESAKPVDAGRVLEHVDHYVRFERDAADRAHSERFERRVEEIKRELSAQAAVIAQARSGQ